jgi:lysozyme family protein
MVDFDPVLRGLLGVEGKYSDDPVDAGGETYCGISRLYHPYWSGWALIDAHRSDPSFPVCLDQDERLNAEIRAFYKHQYWDSFWGDDMISQALAERMLDIAANMGTGRAVGYLQQALNILNRNEFLYDDILEDGVYGPKTHEALDQYMRKDKVEYLLKVILILQGKHYLDYMRRSPIQEKFARGWINRLEIDVM